MTARKRAAIAEPQPDISSHRARHLQIGEQQIITQDGVRAAVTIDEAESPIAWLVRRRGRDGRALIEAHQFQAGERLRGDFTRAHMMPRTTANWESPVAGGRRAPGIANFSDVVIAARQRVRNAVEAAGPEFSGLLLDVCCFLKPLDDIERERSWPARSAKVVLRLALERLARHYGLAAQAAGSGRSQVRTWFATDADFSADGV